MKTLYLKIDSAIIKIASIDKIKIISLLSFLIIGLLDIIFCEPLYSQYSKIQEFETGTDGMSHLTGEFISDGTYLYGTVLSGGANGMGYLFRMKKDGTGFQSLFDFDDTNIGSDNTSISLTIGGSILYGVADKGGASGDGIIFKINNNGTEFHQIYEFEGTDGSNPYGQMIMINTNLIGTTIFGGVNNKGTIFKFNINTGILTKIHEFSSAGVPWPTGRLILYNSSLYGMTTNGGSNLVGTLYKINYDGSGYEVLHNFVNSTGSKPMGTLVLIDSWLYGTTSSGGEYSKGTVFKINLAGTEYRKIFSFSGSNGNTPQSNLIQVENRLYGTTTYGGVSNEGVIFMIYTDESGSDVLYNFTNAYGKFPKSSLVASGSYLIGTTTEGGTQSGGVIYKLNTGYPSKQTAYVHYSTVQPDQVGLIWGYNGDGSSRAFFMKKGSTGTACPKDGTTYNANTIFGQGSQIDATGWFCIYNGTGYQFGPVTGLEPNTTYRVMAIEYNGILSEEKYLISYNEENPNNLVTKNGIIGSSEGISINVYATTLDYKHTIADEGINPLISNGICWAEHPEPTFDDNKYIEGAGPGVYNIRIGNLETSTTYYGRTFLIYPNDTIYGDVFSFTTVDIPTSLDMAYDMLMGPSRTSSTYYTAWWTDPNNWAFGSILGGDANKGSDAGDQPFFNDIEKYMTTPTNEATRDKWLQFYQGVYICNDAIIAVNHLYPGANPEKEPLLAALRFQRAFCYFELIKVFGPKLPWIDENNFYDNTPVSNDNPIWSNVENDFLYSIEYLPDVSDKPGHANLWAAKAFYAKLLLFEKKYSGALTIFNDLILNGKTTNGQKYALLDHFDYNFKYIYNNNAESVLAQQPEISFERANQGYLLAGIYNNSFGSGCCGFFQPSHFLANSYKVDANGLPMFDPDHNSFPFEATDIKNDEGIPYTSAYTYDSGIALDPRLDWTVGRRGIMYLDWGINTGSNLLRDQSYGGCYVGVKHNFTKLDRQTGNVCRNGWVEVSLINYNLMRFADLLLMAAECEIEVGDPETARSYVNQIRTRADNSHVKNDGINDACNYQIGLYTTPWIKDNYSREAVRFERKLELALEGHRFFDLARWGGVYASKELNEGYLANESEKRSRFIGVTFDTCRLHFTIPQSIEFYLPENRNLNDPEMSLAAYSPSGLPINYTVDNPSVVKIEGNKLIIMGTGTTTVTASLYIESNCIPESTVNNVITIHLPAFLNVTPEDMNVENTTGSTDFNINSNTTWTITSSEPWVLPNITSGTGNETITLNYQTNPIDIPRTATITIYGNGVEIKSVAVTQDAGVITKVEDDNSDEILIYPNPTGSILYIEGLPLNSRISVFDIYGKLVMMQYPTENQINVSTLLKGIYFIRFDFNNVSVTKIFIKNKLVN